MKRLTKRDTDGNAYYPECFHKCDGVGTSEKCNSCDLTDAICETLAAYEDVGLTPEQVEIAKGLALQVIENTIKENEKAISYCTADSAKEEIMEATENLKKLLVEMEESNETYKK